MDFVGTLCWLCGAALLAAGLVVLVAALVAFAPQTFIHEEDVSNRGGRVPFDPVWPLIRALVSPLKAFVYDPVNAGETLPPLSRTFLGVRVQPELLAGLHALRRKSHAEDPRDGAAEPSTPLFYLEVVSFAQFIVMMANPAFPFALLGSVHARTRIMQQAPIPMGVQLKLCTWLGSARPHRRGTEVDFHAEATVQGASGAAWKNTTTVLFFHRRPHAQQKGTAYEPQLRSSALVDEGVPLAVDTGFVYAALCKDYNPIHLMGWSARLFGFKRAIVHGMCLLEKSLPALQDTAVALHSLSPATVGGPITDLQVEVEQQLMQGLRGAPAPLRRRLLEGAAATTPLVLTVNFRKPVFLPSMPRVQTHVASPDAIAEAVGGDGWAGPVAAFSGVAVAYEVRDEQDSVCLYGTLALAPAV